MSSRFIFCDQDAGPAEGICQPATPLVDPQKRTKTKTIKPRLRCDYGPQIIAATGIEGGCMRATEDRQVALESDFQSFF